MSVKGSSVAAKKTTGLTVAPPPQPSFHELRMQLLRKTAEAQCRIASRVVELVDQGLGDMETPNAKDLCDYMTALERAQKVMHVGLGVSSETVAKEDRIEHFKTDEDRELEVIMGRRSTSLMRSLG